MSRDPKLKPGELLPEGCSWITIGSSSSTDGSSSSTGSREMDGRLPPPNLWASSRTAVIQCPISSADSNTINMIAFAALEEIPLPRKVTLATRLCRLLTEPVGSGMKALSSPPFVICRTQGRPGITSLANASVPAVSRSTFSGMRSSVPFPAYCRINPGIKMYRPLVHCRSALFVGACERCRTRLARRSRLLDPSVSSRRSSFSVDIVQCGSSVVLMAWIRATHSGYCSSTVGPAIIP